MLTLPGFLDVSYALLVEDHQRVAPMNDFMSLAQAIAPDEVERERVPSPRQVEEQNESSLALLEGMLKGVKAR